MSRPALAAVAIITFLNSWNLFLEPLIFLSSLEMFTLPLALSNFNDSYGLPLWNLQLAATTLAVVPILIVYLMHNDISSKALRCRASRDEEVTFMSSVTLRH